MVAVLDDSMEAPAEFQLIRDFRNGKEKAAAALWRAFSKALIYYSFTITDDQEESRDIVSDGFIELWTRRKNFDDMIKIKHFLYTAVRTKSIDSYRARIRHDQIEKEISHFADQVVDNEFLKSEVMELFNELMNLLTPKQREIVTATILDGQNGQDVARHLMIHETTLYRNKKEALEILVKFAQENSWRYPALLPYLLSLLEMYKHYNN